MIVLGIESSCDETGVAIVDHHGHILSHVLYSQYDEHKKFGGVVPEIAARAHVDRIDTLVIDALNHANISINDIDGFAATTGPGLIGGVIVGVMVAKGLALATGRPFIAVNHLEAHALTVRLSHDVPFPYLLLLVSGGHAEILIAKDVGSYEVLGRTYDDAVGEAFDKVAKIMGLGYPGGPIIEKLAQNGNPLAFDLPAPMIHRPGCDLSFSGLKTAVLHQWQAIEQPDDTDRCNMAASFQRAVIIVLTKRLSNAIAMAQEKIVLKHVVIAGGVAANRDILEALTNLCHHHHVACVAPPPSLCTDNGIMVAWAGLERLRRGFTDPLDTEAKPRWPLETMGR